MHDNQQEAAKVQADARKEHFSTSVAKLLKPGFQGGSADIVNKNFCAYVTCLRRKRSVA